MNPTEVVAALREAFDVRSERAEATDDNAAPGKGVDDMTDEKSDDQPDIIPHSDDATTCTQLADCQFGQYCKCDATSSKIMNVTCLGVCEVDATNATTTTGPNTTRRVV